LRHHASLPQHENEPEQALNSRVHEAPPVWQYPERQLSPAPQSGEAPHGEPSTPRVALQRPMVLVFGPEQKGVVAQQSAAEEHGAPAA